MDVELLGFRVCRWRGSGLQGFQGAWFLCILLMRWVFCLVVRDANGPVSSRVAVLFGLIYVAMNSGVSFVARLWLTSAFRCNSFPTTSKCPLWQAMYSGVATPRLAKFRPTCSSSVSQRTSTTPR